MLELIKVVLAGKKATESTSSRKNKMYQKEKMYPPPVSQNEPMKEWIVQV